MSDGEVTLDVARGAAGPPQSAREANRRWRWAIAAGLVVVAVVVATTSPDGDRRQEIGVPRNGQELEIQLDDRWVDEGVIAGAWAVDPYDLLGEALYASDLEHRPVEVFLDIGGHDALIVYGLYPNCAWAPDILAEARLGVLSIEIRSHGGCQADLMRATRAVAVEFGDGRAFDEVVATHRDPA